MSNLEKMSAAYWDAFRAGYILAGGKPEDYPTWDESADPIKAETLRCLRHAAEALRGSWGSPFDEVFPSAPAEREIGLTNTDERFITSLRIAQIERAANRQDIP